MGLVQRPAESCQTSTIVMLSSGSITVSDVAQALTSWAGLRQSSIPSTIFREIVTLSRCRWAQEAISRSERSFTVVQADGFHDVDGTLTSWGERIWAQHKYCYT